jgi:hypothetical protein
MKRAAALSILVGVTLLGVAVIAEGAAAGEGR